VRLAVKGDERRIVPLSKRARARRVEAMLMLVAAAGALVTAPGEQILNDYACDETLFTKIDGTPSVVVTKVSARIPSRSARKEQILDNSAAIRLERFRNLLGLYVDRFTWWRDSL